MIAIVKCNPSYSAHWESKVLLMKDNHPSLEAIAFKEPRQNASSLFSELDQISGYGFC
ncbi:MAG TPA: hypothetical protein VFS97_10795 [Nitrososphaeraceae archaeon]|nr:hypothetical protein [Nitrososphaeraceae archaeon]